MNPDATINDGPQVRVFVSYSRKDKKWLDDRDFFYDLEKSVIAKGGILWYDKEREEGIKIGDPFEEVIRSEIAKSHIAILLVSYDFLTSEFIQKVELPDIEARRGTFSAYRIMSIRVAPTGTQDMPFKSFDYFPATKDDLRNLAEGPYLAARAQILDALSKHVEELKKKFLEEHEAVPVPNLIGMTREEAEKALTVGDLRVGDVAPAYSGHIPEGHVVSSRPKADSKVKPNSTVDLVISKGLQPSQPRPRQVSLGIAALVAVVVVLMAAAAVYFNQRSQPSVDVTGPVFSDISVTPGVAGVGTPISLTFTTGEALASDPEVTVNSHPAAFQSRTANKYTYTYTIMAADPAGMATLAIRGTDLAGNSGAASVGTGLQVAEPSEPPPPPTPISWKTTGKEGVLTLPGDVKMEFVSIPPGEFMMGSPETDKDRIENEGPQHRVTIAQEFWLGKYEVTQAQWRAVMGDNPSHFKDDGSLPADSVTWDDCQAFIQKLNGKRAGMFRLPTEAEWEYACRAATATRYYWGDDAGATQINDYAWYDGNRGSGTHSVGQKKPNAWGLYDMSGNVSEWCEDDYHESYTGAPADGRAWIDSPRASTRMIRGGYWGNSLGFRLAAVQ